MSFESPMDVLVHVHVMNLQEEKLSLSWNCLILEPVG